jgi:hypothetical protein
MTVDFHQVYLAVERGALGLLTLGTGGKVVHWLYKRYKKTRENIVLGTFFHNADGPWQSAHGVLGDLGIRAALSDARGFIVPQQTGWPAFIHWWKVAPYRWRHYFRRAFVIPSKEEADKVLKGLWERGMLIRAGWTHTKNEFYRLKD